MSSLLTFTLRTWEISQLFYFTKGKKRVIYMTQRYLKTEVWRSFEEIKIRFFRFIITEDSVNLDVFSFPVSSRSASSRFPVSFKILQRNHHKCRSVPARSNTGVGKLLLSCPPSIRLFPASKTQQIFPTLFIIISFQHFVSANFDYESVKTATNCCSSFCLHIKKAASLFQGGWKVAGHRHFPREKEG